MSKDLRCLVPMDPLRTGVFQQPRGDSVEHFKRYVRSTELAGLSPINPLRPHQPQARTRQRPPTTQLHHSTPKRLSDSHPSSSQENPEDQGLSSWLVDPLALLATMHMASLLIRVHQTSPPRKCAERQQGEHQMEIYLPLRVFSRWRAMHCLRPADPSYSLLSVSQHREAQNRHTGTDLESCRAQ